MKIYGKGKKTTELDLKLKSVDTRFRLYIEPFPSPYDDVVDTVEPSNACIEFEDSGEIAALIDALQKFKTRSERRMGKWKKYR